MWLGNPKVRKVRYVGGYKIVPIEREVKFESNYCMCTPITLNSSKPLEIMIVCLIGFAKKSEKSDMSGVFSNTIE